MERERRHILLEGLQLADTLVNLASLWAAYVIASGSAPFALATLEVPVSRSFPSACSLFFGSSFMSFMGFITLTGCRGGGAS